MPHDSRPQAARPDLARSISFYPFLIDQIVDDLMKIRPRPTKAKAKAKAKTKATKRRKKTAKR